MTHWLGAAGVDQPAIHQIQQLPEHHELDLGLGEVEVCQADVGEPGESGLDAGGYASFAGSFGAGTVSMVRRVPCWSAAAIAER